MRIHYIPPWIPLPAQPVKKPEKGRKFFHSEDETESTDPSEKPLSDSGNQDPDTEHTDILA